MAYRVTSAAGTSAVTAVRPEVSGSVPMTRPRRICRSVITAPTYSSATTRDTASTGSSSVTLCGEVASFSARAPAAWKAISLESTECDFPSVRVTLRSTIG